MRREGQDNPDPAAEGERLVFHEYCISRIFLSLRRPSAVRRLRRRQRGWIKEFLYTILSFGKMGDAFVTR